MDQRPADAATVLQAVRMLYTELHRSGSKAAEVGLDSTLEGDLGFDSLARVELLVRLEQLLGTHLPESILGQVETVADLAQAVRAARAAPLPAPIPGLPAPATAPAAGLGTRQLQAGKPSRATTLPEVLRWRLERDPDAAHLVLLGEQPAASLSYRALYEGAQRVAGSLHRVGIAPGAAVALMLPTGMDYFFAFFGALLAGAVPVPIYPPVRASQLEEHVRRYAAVLANARVQVLITVPEAAVAARLLRLQVPTLKDVLAMAGAAAAEPAAAPMATPASDSIALLQYTSGSTGAPKGVRLTHANVLANIRAMGTHIRADESDVFVSWLPLYHDMGLIGAWLGSLYFGCLLVIMPPTAFLARPVRWLRTIHDYRGTLSASPNFGYELCARRIAEADLAGLDLSSWRIAFNGAEPVAADTLERFEQRFARHGFRSTAMTPVYGLAEAAVGVTFPPVDRGPMVDRVDRDQFARRGLALAAPQDHPHALRFVSCGQPLPGYQVRIIDGVGSELPERVEGALQFCGPSATDGYFGNPDATAQLLHGAWRDTGDRAYLAGGEIYITGRTKDIIIRRGRHIHPEQLEREVAEVDGVRKGCVAAFGAREPNTATEKLIVLAETHETDPARRALMVRRINQSVVDSIGEPPDEVLLAAPRTVLKTSSGKLRRAATRAAYEHGSLARARASVARQVWRLSADAVRQRLHGTLQTAAHLAYGLYCWSSLAGIAAVFLPLLLLQRRAAPAWALNHRVARWLIRAWRIPFSITGQSTLDLRSPHVLVVNHSSYVDSVFVTALLSDPHGFVAKTELQRLPLLRACLSRLGTLFIERFSAEHSAAEVQRLQRALALGQSLVVYPEGTFTRQTGLRPFHLGAFQAAVAAGVPVIPLALRGTRSLLRDQQHLPHRVPIGAVFGLPLAPAAGGDAFDAAVRLRDAAREHILQHCGEPDLA